MEKVVPTLSSVDPLAYEGTDADGLGLRRRSRRAGTAPTRS